jgi:hypothetical protein
VRACDGFTSAYEGLEKEGPKVGILMGADKLVLTLPGLTWEDTGAAVGAVGRRQGWAGTI